MPYYLFEYKGIVKEIFQHMNDNHVYEENGIKWNRVFQKPQATITSISKLDPFDGNKFKDITKEKRGNLGNILDLSNECSEKRAKQSYDGKDPLKSKVFSEYSKTRHGKLHPEERKQKAKELTKEIILNIKKKIDK